MLILQRRLGESVIIGNDVTVTVLGVKGTQIRLGITAPKDIAVHRKEVYERIKAESQTPSEQPMDGTTAAGECQRRAGRRSRG